MVKAIQINIVSPRGSRQNAKNVAWQQLHQETRGMRWSSEKRSSVTPSLSRALSDRRIGQASFLRFRVSRATEPFHSPDVASSELGSSPLLVIFASLTYA
ncbi:hypothetical protein NPIL_215611 [Nephila pilipes]|uniref:Uncharacterized protein n=1 Tax=Nephila pilipes TaxID=299642 RepID=A0A8X6TFV6_NEPPI|nr:hypothetical protein NPIL_215611 [Nephila pilipes]